MLGRWGRAIALVAAGSVTAAAPAWAEFKVRDPQSEPGAIAVEQNSSDTFDRSAQKRGDRDYTLEIEYGVNETWITEIEGEAERLPGPGNPTRFTFATWENMVLLTQEGESWADLALFGEYGRATARGLTDEVTFGPLIRKEFGSTLNTVNLFVEKEVGTHAGGRPLLSYAWKTQLTLDPSYLEPGFEIYGAVGAITHPSPLRDQDHRAGPVLYGLLRDLGPGKLTYEVGYLFGLTRAAPDGTAKLRLEYELHF